MFLDDLVVLLGADDIGLIIQHSQKQRPVAMFYESY